MQNTVGADQGRSGPRANILLVDDEPANLLALEAILAELDQHLVKALSGEEALRHLLAQDFAVVLLDVRMQGLSGFETAQLIRGRPKLRHIPLIFLTAYEDSDLAVAQGYGLGAVDYLVKPPVPEILRAKVRVFVELFQKTEQVQRQAEQLRAMEQQVFRGHLATQYACARVMAEAETVAAAMPRVLEAICRGLAWDWSSLWKLNPGGQVLHCVETWHDPASAFPRFEEVTRHRSLAHGEGLPGRVWASGQPAWLNDVQQDPNFPRLRVAKEEGLRAALGFPIGVDSEFLGMMEFLSRQVREPDPDMVQMLAALGSQLGQFIKRKRAEEELRDFVENAPVGLHWVGPDGILLWANQAELDLLGYTRAEYLGHPITEFHTDPSVIEDVLRRLANKEVVTSFETQLRCKDGSVKHVLISSNVLWEEGEFVHTRCFTRDITDRKQAEEGLRESEARKSGVLEAALDCVITIDQEGKVVEWNRAAEKTFGYRREEALGREMGDLIIPPAYRASHRRGLAHFLATGEGPVLEKRLEMPALRADGSVFPAELAIVPIRSVGKLLFTGYLRDITERKRAEKELQEQREWLEVTLSSIGDAVIATDTRGLVMLLNPVAELLTGWTQAAATGQLLETIFHIVNEDSHEPVESPVARVLRGERLQGLANHTLLLAKNGVARPIDASASPIHDGNTLHGVVLVFHDITERRELEKRLEERAAKLLEADRCKDEFLAMLAHELRNPLAPLRNALHLLRLKGGHWKTVEQVREMMTRQVNHLGRLVDDLLDVSRITRGKIALRKERLDLAQLLGQAVEDDRNAFDERSLTLTLEVPETPVWVLGDATRLTQILDNLLGNARKFTDPKGQVVIQLATDVAQGMAVLTVRDTGIGIEPEILPRIFEAFAQADRSLDRSRGGLGLGLALVKGLVELHGGTIRAASAGLGQGSAFTLTLPQEKELPALSEAPVSMPPTQKRLRILVVEDNRDAAESLRMLLEIVGYEATVAYSGTEGVQAAASLRPDVVVCDIGLPGMDGFAVASALRSNPETAKARLIALTGYGGEENKRRALEAGFDEHLVKPVDPERLIGQLDPQPN